MQAPSLSHTDHAVCLLELVGTDLGTPSILIVLCVIVVSVLRVREGIELVLLGQTVPHKVGLGVCGKDRGENSLIRSGRGHETDTGGQRRDACTEEEDSSRQARR